MFGPPTSTSPRNRRLNVEWVQMEHSVANVCIRRTLLIELLVAIVHVGELAGVHLGGKTRTNANNDCP